MDTPNTLEAIPFLSLVLATVLYYALKQLAARLGDDTYQWLKSNLIRGWRWVVRSPQPVVATAMHSAADTTSTPSPTPPQPAVTEPLPAAKPPTPSITTPKAQYYALKYGGSGELCEWYRATQQLSGSTASQPVILKIAREAQHYDWLQHEANILRLLQLEVTPYSKHLPQVIDQFRMGNQAPALVFPEYEGYTLTQLRQPFPNGIEPRHLLWILRRCLSVLGYAHSKGILHGNITPDHILIRPQDHNVWLLDWCYAVNRPKETGQRFRVVHPLYSGPEVAEGSPPLPASDIYALGQVMIEAAGGELASQSIPHSVPERLRRLLQFMVKSSAMQRPSDAWKLYQELDSIRQELFGKHQFVEFIVPNTLQNTQGD